MILLDTNVLLSLVNPLSRAHRDAAEFIKQQEQRSQPLVAAPQCIIEMWNVMTRPTHPENARTGFGWSNEHAISAREFVMQQFFVLPEPEGLLLEWKRMVDAYHVRGVQVHDCRLVAFMTLHNIKHVASFNMKDFVRYTSITAHNPSAPLP